MAKFYEPYFDNLDKKILKGGARKSPLKAGAGKSPLKAGATRTFTTRDGRVVSFKGGERQLTHRNAAQIRAVMKKKGMSQAMIDNAVAKHEEAKARRAESPKGVKMAKKEEMRISKGARGHSARSSNSKIAAMARGRS